MQTLVQRLAGFAREIALSSLPEGIGKLKGKAGIAYGRLTGGAGNAGILGTGDRVSPFGAAFANGELTQTGRRRDHPGDGCEGIGGGHGWRGRKDLG